jgi:hypothetical protein
LAWWGTEWRTGTSRRPPCASEARAPGARPLLSASAPHGYEARRGPPLQRKPRRARLWYDRDGIFRLYKCRNYLAWAKAEGRMPLLPRPCPIAPPAVAGLPRAPRSPEMTVAPPALPFVVRAERAQGRRPTPASAVLFPRRRRQRRPFFFLLDSADRVGTLTSVPPGVVSVIGRRRRYYGGTLFSASSLFRPRCSACSQEVQRGFCCARTGQPSATLGGSRPRATTGSFTRAGGQSDYPLRGDFARGGRPGGVPYCCLTAARSAAASTHSSE